MTLTTLSLSATQRSQMAEALELSRFLIRQTESADSELVQRRRNRIRTIQQSLQSCVHPICQDTLPLVEIPLSVRRAFVQAALLVSRYFAVGGVGWRGTLASPTLAKYRLDPIPAIWETPAGVAAMGDRFALPVTVMMEIETHLAQVDHEINQQRRIMTAVLETVGLAIDAADPLPSAPFVSLFGKLFNGIQVAPNKLSAIFTPTQLYFCVDFPDAEDEQAWAGLTPADRQADLKQLHQQLADFSFQKFKRFPTFGPCDPAGIDSQWIQQVCDRLNVAAQGGQPVSPEAVIQRLSKSVGVLPQKDAEMFLVHDIWGHYWQLLFSQFEGDYATLADCGEALRIQETAYTSEGPLTCRELFHFEGVTVSVDPDRARQFFHGEVRQRLGLLFTHLLGELVADIAEFKFVWTNPNAAHELPSTSAFTDYPTNLDLTLADLDFLFLRILQPLLELQISPMEASPLETALLAIAPVQQRSSEQWLRLKVNLKQAIAELHQIFLAEYSAAYLPTLATEDSLFAEVAITLLHLQNVINTLYTDPQFTQSDTVPFQDLLIVFISSYCSGDSYAEFWQVANVLADYFIPCWQYLRDLA
ncbi:MAG: hypothetical protein F6K42_15215 [Leptolyngbya sp. SIO1D8]|nr:hypothetical protein [Leptolyngbya sp. SIO1D8]